MDKACPKCKSKFETKSNAYYCLQCNKEYQKKWRLKRLELGLPVRGKASKEWWKKYYQSDKYKAQQRRLQAKYRKDPNLRFKHQARWALNHALQSGKLFKEACTNCGNQKSEGHHPDYSKPLLVVWLCRKCHKLEHTQAESEG